MGIDFGKFFSDAGEKAQDALNDLVKVGKPALEASLEQWGIDVLQKELKQDQAELSAAVKEVTAKDPDPGTFGAALSATVKNTVFENYGMHILIGVVALVGVGFLLRSK